MSKRGREILLVVFFGFFGFLLSLAIYFFVGEAKPAAEIDWGVDFSQKHAQNLGLDWQDVYLALLGDLQVRNLKLSTSWDLLEKTKDNYDFQDLDWQIRQAQFYGAKILLVMGMKTPRWPECHLPAWAKALSKEKQQEAILGLLEKIVLRYKGEPVIWAWQIENEPLFPFGDCPWRDKKFLQQEINLVKSLDSRPIVISDSGEGSFWLQAASLGDIVGTTIYRKVWFKEIGRHFDYPYPPVFYWRKAEIIKKLFGKEVICIELQAEPWGRKLLYDTPLEDQREIMTLKLFRDNLEFAKKTGLETFYFWGGEWWYWLKEKHGDSSFWDEAKKIFNQ